jgi:uncharacterized repeat protein (TIGR01451 family)
MNPVLVRSYALIAVIVAIVACERVANIGGPPPPGTPKIDLTMTTARNKDSVAEGGTVTFTLTVNNLGPTAASNVTAGDSLPAGLAYSSHVASNATTYSPTTKLWTIGTLPMNSPRTLAITASANSGTSGSWQVNRGGVLAAEIDSVIANNSVKDSVKVTAGAGPPPPGPGEPTDPGSGYLWADNFDRYASALAMGSPGNCASGTDGFGIPSAQTTYGQRTTYNFPTNNGCTIQTTASGTQRYDLTTGRSGSGKALRGRVATTTASQGVDWWSPQPSLTHNINKSLVIQYYYNVSTLGLPGNIGMKWIELWISGGHAGRNVQRLQWSTNGSGTPASASTQWRVTDGPANLQRGFQATPPRLSTTNDGAWHRVTYLFKPNTSTTWAFVSGTSSANEVYTGTSSRDGRMAMWVDGIKVIDIQQSLVGVPIPGGGGAVWCYQGDVDWIPDVTGSYIQLPGTINSPMPNPDWIIDIDDLKFWEF